MFSVLKRGMAEAVRGPSCSSTHSHLHSCSKRVSVLSHVQRMCWRQNGGQSGHGPWPPESPVWERDLHITVTVIQNFKLVSAGKGKERAWPSGLGGGPHANSLLLLSSMTSVFGMASPLWERKKSRKPMTHIRHWWYLGQACMTGVQGDVPGVRGVPALSLFPRSAASLKILRAVNLYKGSWIRYYILHFID